MKKLFRLAIVPIIVLSLGAFAPMVSAGCSAGVQFGMCDPCATFMSIECPEPKVEVVVPEVAKSLDYETSISFNDDDLGVVLYKGQEADGSQHMEVYALLDHGQQSDYLFTITQEDLAPYADAHPAQNTLLASEGGVSVYILTTGEIQVNAGPDSEGKMHVKVLNGIPWTTVYGYTVDPE